MSTESIRIRLLQEFEKRRGAKEPERRLTMAALARLAGMSRPQAHKKLHGDLSMSLEESAAFGKPLGLRVTVTIRKVAA